MVRGLAPGTLHVRERLRRCLITRARAGIGTAPLWAAPRHRPHGSLTSRLPRSQGAGLCCKALAGALLHKALGALLALQTAGCHHSCKQLAGSQA